MKIKRNHLFALVWAVCLSTALGCHSGEESNRDRVEEQNKEKFANREEKKDAQFVVNAIDHAYAVLSLAQLGKEKGLDKIVRSRAQQMAESHIRIINKLKTYAADNDISVPIAGPEYITRRIENLYSEEADRFDKKWYEEAIRYNKKMIADFESYTDKADGSLRDVVAATLDILKKQQDALENYIAEAND